MHFYIVPVAEASVLTLVKSIDKVLINPIIIFLFAVALAYFIYGLAQYLLSPQNEEVRKKAKSQMLWGVLGLFIMVAVFGLMQIILSSFGENKIKINDNGNFAVNGDNLVGKNVADNPNNNKDIFGNLLDISSQNTENWPIETFTTDPFPQYKANNSLCWRYVDYKTASTEFDAINTIKLAARSKYLSTNGISEKDQSKQKYPTIYSTEVLYQKYKNPNPDTPLNPPGQYYAWIDARAPIGTGVDHDCKLQELQPAKELPGQPVEEISVPSDFSLTNAPNTPVTSFTTNPFTKVYIEQPNICWHRDILAQDTTEYKTLQDIKKKIRQQFISDNSLDDSTADPNLPTVYGSQVSYDSKGKMYYVWQDARAQINGGKPEDCNLLPDIATSSESQRANPLQGTYVSDAQFYRAVGSGVDSTFIGARSIAINNALVLIAKMKGVHSINNIVHKVMPEEKYYVNDRVFTVTNIEKYYPDEPVYKYDYWVAVQSPR